MRTRLTPESFYARATNPGPNDCWEWQGFRNPAGYGRSSWQGKGDLAHRISFKISKGGIPAGLHILHTCDNRCCINPAHLISGTHAENMADMAAKGRWKPSSNKKRRVA